MRDVTVLKIGRARRCRRICATGWTAGPLAPSLAAVKLVLVIVLLMDALDVLSLRLLDNLTPRTLLLDSGKRAGGFHPNCLSYSAFCALGISPAAPAALPCLSRAAASNLFSSVYTPAFAVVSKCRHELSYFVFFGLKMMLASSARRY